VKLSELSTPALCVDLDAFERNLDRMHSYFASVPCDLRPHFKAHKTPAIARRQAQAGCAGFTTATLGEAELLADEGFDDLLIANEICDPTKMTRLRELAARIPLIVAVDSPESVELIRGTGARVVVDVNVGMPRCGVAPEGAAGVARAAVDAGLELVGVMGYEGHATVVEDVDERAKVTRASMETLTRVAGELRDAGFDITIVSGGSTLTYDVTGSFDGVTEVQAGSYALMDTEFAKSSPFEEALRMLCTVISTQGKLAVLDAGLKTMTIDHGNPALPDDVPADVLYLADEHTSLVVRDGFSSRVGDRMWLRPSHVDPTVNLHDRLYAFRGDEVEEVWPVAGRGYR
jgi:D-serine deaminase-like pyridoxal phosphate-dependent protein